MAPGPVLSVFGLVAVLFFIPTAGRESPCRSTSLSASGSVGVLDVGHLNQYVMVSHCFNLKFSNGM